MVTDFMSSKYQSSLHLCLQVKFDTRSRWAACNSSPAPSEVKGEDGLTSKAAKEEEGKVEGRLCRLFVVVYLTWYSSYDSYTRVQQSVSLLLVFAQPSLFGCNWSCQLWGWPLFEMVREGDRPQSFTFKSVGRLWQGQTWRKGKRRAEGQGWSGGGCVVRDSCPNWHIQYERFDTINSHSYRCTRHRSLVGALSGKGVQRKQGPLAKVCDPPWIPHSRSGKEKALADWQGVKGCVRRCRPEPSGVFQRRAGVNWSSLWRFYDSLREPSPNVSSAGWDFLMEIREILSSVTHVHLFKLLWWTLETYAPYKIHALWTQILFSTVAVARSLQPWAVD